MNRRDALTALGTIAGVAGLSVTAVTATDAEHVVLIMLKAKGQISLAAKERLKASWESATKGTALADVRTVVLDDSVDVEFVRR